MNYSPGPPGSPRRLPHGHASVQHARTCRQHARHQDTERTDVTVFPSAETPRVGPLGSPQLKPPVRTRELLCGIGGGVGFGMGLAEAGATS